MTQAPHLPGRRLAIVLPDLRPGGAERVALRLASDFAEAGHEVDLVLLKAEGELLTLVPPAVRVIDLGARRIRGGLRPLISYLRQRKPHAVQVLMWPLTVLGIVAHRIARSDARLILAEHTMPSRHFATSATRLLSLRLTMRLLYRRADARVAVSMQAALDIARLSGLPASHVEVIYNPVDRPADSCGDEVSMPDPWSVAEERVLTVGSLKPEKNHELLLRAFAACGRDGARLMILGEGPMRPKLEALADALGIAGRLSLPGFKLDPWPYYRTADLFVLSSDYEGYPLVLVEAMRAGVAIVSTDCDSGPREILDGGGYGMLVPPGDVDAMASGIASALRRERNPERLRLRAEHLSGPGTSRRYLELMLGSGSS